MKLSIEIIRDQLKDYNPKATITANLFEIEAVRLFSPDVTLQPNTLYVGRMKDLFVTDSNNIICTHNNDMVLLNTDDMESVLNCILNTLEVYTTWEKEIMDMITSGGMLQDLLDASMEIIKSPILLLDQGQRLLAYNKEYENVDIDPMWNNLIKTGSSPMEFLLEFEEKDPVRRNRRGLYTYEKTVFPSLSWHYNFFYTHKLVGSATIISTGDSFTTGELDTFLLLCKYVENWFSAHIQDQNLIILDNLLQHAIMEDGADNSELIRMFLLKGWKESDLLIIYKLDTALAPFNINRHLCNSINLNFKGVYAITYDLSICMLCNLTINSKQEIESKLIPSLESSRYYATIGQQFCISDSIYSNYQYVSLMSGFVDKKPGHIYSGDGYTMPYLLSELRKSIIPNVIHPAVITLADYDNSHKTELFKTAYVYIKNGRRFQDTVDELNIHRNTLKYRLARISELMNVDLDDANERLHLWISFELSQT